MTTPAKHGLAALTEREKQTLRLIVRGHDAKSVARTLDLSVHTINERLRDARRKVAVNSSREAARLLFEAEGGVVATPEIVGDTPIGDAPAGIPVEETAVPSVGTGRQRLWLTTGTILMLPALALIALVTTAQLAPSPPATATSSPAEAPAIESPAAVAAAKPFLTLIDAQQWRASFAATGAQFRRVNTLKLWTDTSLQVRAPLGTMVARTLLSAELVPAPPRGFQNVKFKTQFTNKTVIETVTLDREAGEWRVVGIVVD